MTNTIFKRKFPDIPITYRVIFKALLSSSYQEIVKAAFDLFNLPIVLVDSDYKPLSFYPPVKIGNDIYDTIVEGKPLATETVRLYQTTFLSKRGSHYDPFYANDGIVADCPRIFAEVNDGKSVYGHLAIFLFDNPVREEDYEIVSLLTDAIRFILSKEEKRGHRLFSEQLSALLDEKANENEKSFSASSLGRRIDGDYAIMVTPLPDFVSLHAYAAMDLGKLYPLLRYAVTTVEDKSLVTLLGLMKKDDSVLKRRRFFEELVGALDIPGARTGVSPIFSSLLEARTRYLQALETASCSDKALSFYEEEFPKPLFALLRREIDLSSTVPESLASLREEDEREGSEYYKTLRTYLLNFKDIQKSCEELLIHRNTLVYRLHRIEEKIGVELGDARTCLRLLTAIELLE